MRVVVDRPIAAGVARRLRDLGHDAVAAVEEPALRGADDDALFGWAAAADRVLVTANVGDFLPLAEEARVRGEAHPGVAFASPARYPRTPLAVDRLVLALDGLLAGGADPERLAERGVHWLQAPPGCPFWPRGRGPTSA